MFYAYKRVLLVCAESTKFKSSLKDAKEFCAENPGWKIDFNYLDPWVWREREQYRLTHQYEALPVFFRDILTKNQNSETEYHYAHRAKDGKSVSYTPSHEYGVLDKRTVISPGRYVQKYFGTILSQSEVREAANKFHMDLFSDLQFHTGGTREAFRFAFEDQDVKSPSSSFRSCMSYHRSHYCSYDLPCHPAEVYAAGDLAIAYFTHPEAPQRVLARSVIYPEKKTHSKIYAANHRYHDLMKARLEADGYSFSEDLFGARLLRIHLGDDDYVMPYIDGEYNGVSTLTDEFFRIIQNGQYEPDTTHGFISI